MQLSKLRGCQTYLPNYAVAVQRKLHLQDPYKSPGLVPATRWRASPFTTAPRGIRLKPRFVSSPFQKPALDKPQGKPPETSYTLG